MKFFKSLLLVPLALIPSVGAQTASTIPDPPTRSEILQAYFSTLPKCAIECISGVITQSTCDALDFFCYERDPKIQVESKKCIITSCTIRESLITKNFTAWASGRPVRDQTHLISYTGVIGGSFTFLAVSLRVLARLPYFGGVWGWDDCTIILAMMPVIPLTGLSVVLTNEGFGKDIWTVPFANITSVLYIYYLDKLFYLLAMTLTKISILLFYLRTFPNHNFRRWVKLTIAVVFFYMLAFIPATVLQCFPIKLAWTQWDRTQQGNCINLHAVGWASVGLHIFMNLLIIVLPLRELSKLAMSRLKRAGVMLIFLMGGFETVASCLRLKWMIQFATSKNATWDYAPIGYLSTLEVHIGIVIACLPALRMLQHHLLIHNAAHRSHRNKLDTTYICNPKGAMIFHPSRYFMRRHSIACTPEIQLTMARNMSYNHTSRTSSEFVRPDIIVAELDAIDPEKGALFEIDGIGRGINRTHIQRGSTHGDAVISLTSPMPVHLNNGRQHSHDNIMPLQAKIITVRKAFTVTRDRDSGSSILRPGSLNPRPKTLTNEKYFLNKVAGLRLSNADSRTEKTGKIDPRPDPAASGREGTPFSPTSLYSRQTDEDEDGRRKARLASIENEFRTLSLNSVRSDDGLSSQERLCDSFWG